MPKKTDDKRIPINSEVQTMDNLEAFLVKGILFGASSVIENQEKQGQQSLLVSDTLPTQASGEEVAFLEKCGAKFGCLAEGDPLFRYVELPRDWKKVPTEHAMWSYLVDDKGRVRAEIFYKAAFYDRDAFWHLRSRFHGSFDYNKYTEHAMWSYLVDDKGRVRAEIFYKAAFYDRDAFWHLRSRFHGSFDYNKYEKENIAIAHVYDGDKIIFSTEPAPTNEKGNSYEYSVQGNRLVEAWLNEHYPDWRKPTAYWD